MRTISIRYFASIREALGIGHESLQTSVATVGDLRDELIARGGVHAAVLVRGKAVRMALNQHMCSDSSELSEGDELAFFPPVTGG